MTIAAMLATIALHVPLPTGITIKTADCPVPGTPHNCATSDGTIYFTGALDGSSDNRLALAHELGHLWDFQHLTEAERDHYAAVIGSTRPWRSASSDIPTAGNLPTGELFADAYGLCAMGPRWRKSFRSWWGPLVGTYGERITHRTLSITCWLIHQPSYAGTARNLGV